MPNEQVQNDVPHSSPSTVSIRVAFSGGLELLFQNQRNLKLQIPEFTTLAELIRLLATTRCDSKRIDLFIKDDTARPGILVLVNESDWELEGEGNYIVQDGDEVLFMSTLHGG